jgi:hypothetical protein
MNSSGKQEAEMRHGTTIALLLVLVSASAYAQHTPIKMTFSGNAGATTIDLKQPNASTSEENLAGNGTLGSFSFRLIKASENAPQPSTTCAALFFPNTAGGGIFRFQDGSLLYVNLTGGGDCIDFVHMSATCTLTFTINGGTGRFKTAAGILTLTETAVPVLADGTASKTPVFFSETGGFTGTISGLPSNEDSQDRR